MKKASLLYCFIFTSFCALAQKQANIWYFGNKVGLDFNQSPPAPLSNGAINAVEGSAVISDQNGRLLFYTNGLSLVNRKNGAMKNGGSLNGDLSSTDNTVIVPSPGNDSIYYLFTIGAAYSVNKGFSYSVINMKGDAGFGEVISKNVSLEPNAYEKLGAIRHCNNKDVWVVIHKWDSDEYRAYLVTGSGVSTNPVISHSGLFITSTMDNTIGTLKFSSDGRKVAAAHAYENNKIELMDFNNTTGMLTNPVLFSPDAPGTPRTYTGVYGAEFSPNGNLLYVSDNISSDDSSTLYQFDISSHNASTILSSKRTIARISPWFAGALQTGPDQKIYMAMLGDTAVSVIENPDVYGSGCNFNYNKISMGQNVAIPVQFGLPNFIQSYFNPLANPYDFSRSGNCADRDVSFTINRVNNIDSVKWDFGDGQRSQLLSPVNHYSSPGTYQVQLIVYKIDCSGLNDTIRHAVWVADNNGFLGADTGSCALLSFEIGVDEIANASYMWNTGSFSNKIIADTFGLFWLRIEQNGCTVTDSVNVYAKPKPVVTIRGGKSVCPGVPVILDAGNVSANAYLWNTGETTSAINVSTAGNYRVAVTGNSCVVADSVNVSWGDCEAFIPNAFSPNGHNNYFGVASGFAAFDFSMQVFDRWGNIVFTAGDITKKWDGNFRGKAQPAGAYSWAISYTNQKGIKRSMRGTVLLIR